MSKKTPPWENGGNMLLGGTMSDNVVGTGVAYVDDAAVYEKNKVDGGYELAYVNFSDGVTRADGGNEFYIKDHLGSTRAIVKLLPPEAVACFSAGRTRGKTRGAVVLPFAVVLHWLGQWFPRAKTTGSVNIRCPMCQYVMTDNEFTSGDWLLKEAMAYLAYGAIKQMNEPPEKGRKKFTGKEFDEDAGLI